MPFDLKLALSRQAEGKALPVIPQLQGVEPVSIYQAGYKQGGRQPAVLSQREAALHSQVYGGTEAMDWVMDAISLYSEPTAAAPYHLEQDDGTQLIQAQRKGTPPDAQVGPQDLYRLLDEPNPFMLYDELLELLIIDLLLVGNAYWFKWRMTSNGRPLAIYRLCPSHVKVVPDVYGPKAYEYQPPGASEKLTISPEQLIHFKRPNPHSYHYGLGIIQGGGRAFDLDLAVTDTMAGYYENKADPSLIVSSERRVPRDVFNKLRAQLRARVAGPRKSGELLVLEAGLKASSLSANARDALFHDLSIMSRDRVFASFKASPKLVGIVDEQAGVDKLTDLRREFDTNQLAPFTQKLATRITKGLTDAWGVKFVIDYRYQMAVEDILRLASGAATVPGIKVRELRGILGPLGVPESTGDRSIDEMVLNLPGENAGPTGQGPGGGPTLPNRGLPGQPGRPPLGEHVPAIPPGGAQLPPGARARRPGATGTVPQGKSLDLTLRRLEALTETKALTQEGRTSVGKKLSTEQRPPDTTERFRRAEIDAARDQIAHGLAAAAHELERDLFTHVEGKAFKRSDIVQRIRNSKAWAKFTDRITQVLEAVAKAAISASVIHHGDVGIIPKDELDYESIAKAVVHRPDGARGITKTLKQRILDKVKEARVDGAKPEVQAAVQGVIKEWSEGQAATVADTEATHAYNEATLTLAESLGHQTVHVTDGVDFDEPCQQANGQEWDIEYAREHRVEHPRCRRAFLLSPVGA